MNCASGNCDAAQHRLGDAAPAHVVVFGTIALRDQGSATLSSSCPVDSVNSAHRLQARLQPQQLRWLDRPGEADDDRQPCRAALVM